MPTETFLNLPKEKKNKIIEAIKGEFARVPFDKVSINKVIQEADISRGSFYMYFDDKKDALITVLSSYNDEVNSTIEKSFKQHNGDIFEAFNDILKFTAEFGTAKENIDFCRNIFSNQTAQNDILLQFTNRGRMNDYLEWLKSSMDMQSLKLESSNDVYDIVDILTAVTQKATVDIFLNIEEKEEVLERYKNKIAILKRGMLKENS